MIAESDDKKYGKWNFGLAGNAVFRNNLFRMEILPMCLHINCLVFNGASNGI